MVRALTDNRNRTAPSMRHIFSAYGGNLGESGSVSNFLFDYRGVITIEDVTDIEALEVAIMETPAEDYSFEGKTATIITDRTHLAGTRKKLEENGYVVAKASFEYTPKNYVEVTNGDNILKLYKMLEDFHNDEDVEMVWNNADIPDALWQEAIARAEASKFHT